MTFDNYCMTLHSNYFKYFCSVTTNITNTTAMTLTQHFIYNHFGYIRSITDYLYIVFDQSWSPFVIPYCLYYSCIFVKNHFFSTLTLFTVKNKIIFKVIALINIYCVLFLQVIEIFQSIFHMFGIFFEYRKLRLGKYSDIFDIMFRMLLQFAYFWLTKNIQCFMKRMTVICNIMGLCRDMFSLLLFIERFQSQYINYNWN